MATLLGKKPKETFPLLIKFSTDHVDDQELRLMEDGNGNPLPLKLSATSLELGGQRWPITPPEIGSVLIAGSNNQLSWGKASSGGVESLQSLATDGAILQLPNYSDGLNYDVTLTQATQIILPELVDIEESIVLAITIKIKQTTNGAITWSGGERQVTFDDPSITPAGAGKTTIYSFVYYSGASEWLGGVIWRQV